MDHFVKNCKKLPKIYPFHTLNCQEIFRVELIWHYGLRRKCWRKKGQGWDTCIFQRYVGPLTWPKWPFGYFRQINKSVDSTDSWGLRDNLVWQNLLKPWAHYFKKCQESFKLLILKVSLFHLKHSHQLCLNLALFNVNILCLVRDIL